jgi:3-oxoacyl-[acyl-carrier protein] reductase
MVVGYGREVEQIGLNLKNEEKVVVHGRDNARARNVVAKITEPGGQAAIALGDLMTDDGLEAVIKATQEAFGGIDILVNNAGGSNSTTAPGWFDDAAR